MDSVNQESPGFSRGECQTEQTLFTADQDRQAAIAKIAQLAEQLRAWVLIPIKY
ncbi:MAG: hypothetical protein ACK58N_03795 [Synechocystis sp.]